MKTCPRCQKTYSDDNLNFCLEDGSVLTKVVDMQETIRVNEPRGTFQQPSAPVTNQQQVQYSGQPQFTSQQPAKKSRTWVWVLLILGAVVLLCGGGLIGMLAYVGSRVETIANNVAANAQRTPERRTVSNSNTSNKTNSATSTPEIGSRTDLTEVDLDIFVKDSSKFGTTSLDNGELTMGALEKGYYYALVAPAEYSTVDADTRVTVSNPSNAGGSLGYGLIFHSNPLPLQQDYAFLIDAKTGKYRIVHHSPKKEEVLNTWTSSSAINKGTAENTLEARDTDDEIELYINGTMVTSIPNIYGYPNGVVGLYSGDGIKAVFKDLQIRK